MMSLLFLHLIKCFRIYRWNPQVDILPTNRNGQHHNWEKQLQDKTPGALSVEFDSEVFIYIYIQVHQASTTPNSMFRKKINDFSSSSFWNRTSTITVLHSVIFFSKNKDQKNRNTVNHLIWENKLQTNPSPKSLESQQTAKSHTN